MSLSMMGRTFPNIKYLPSFHCGKQSNQVVCLLLRILRRTIGILYRCLDCMVSYFLLIVAAMVVYTSRHKIVHNRFGFGIRPISCVRANFLTTSFCIFVTYCTPVLGYNLNNTGFGKGPHYNAVDKFKQFIDILPRNQLGRPDDISIMEGDDTICGIDFGKNLMRFRKCRLDQTPPIVKQDNTYTGPRIVRIWRNEAMQSNPPGFNHDHVALKKAKNV